MLVPALLLFILFLLLSAMFSSSETAIIGSSPHKIDYLSRQGSKSAQLLKKLLRKVDDLLATILIGNTLVNAAAASVCTYIFVSFVPNKNEAVLLSTLATTLLILFFSEINPKTYAAYNPIKISFLFVRPIQIFMWIFFPLVRFFTFLTRLVFPKQRRDQEASRTLNEEEMKLLLSMGIKGMSSLRKKMIAGVLDIGTRPVREIMIPRTQVKAINMDASLDKIMTLLHSEGFSRFPVYRERMDNIEGVIHVKDLISHLGQNREFNLKELLRTPFFVPESASLERVMLQMLENVNHLVFVVDEFGNMEGILTLEDIIEEIVGEIQDEYDVEAEKLIHKIKENEYFIRGNASMKNVNQRIPVHLPEEGDYTTIAGFFLKEFGRIPEEGDSLKYHEYTFTADKMKKRHIYSLRVYLPDKKKT
jgi:putative hemolysin